jgi:hypothetical protein
MILEMGLLVRKMLERVKLDTPNTHVHDRSLSWFGTPNTHVHDRSLSWFGTGKSPPPILRRLANVSPFFIWPKLKVQGA